MARQDRPTVLVVEDDVENADLYSEWLSTDYDVRTTYDGDQALAVLDDSVDVVLLDRRMPEVPGDELLELIRDRGLSCRVTIVTAIDPDFDIIELGFDEYLTKPVSAIELRRTVERMLSLREYDQEVQEYFSLASKIATLHASQSQATLADSEEYAELHARFATAEERARSALDDLFEQRPAEWVLQHAVGGNTGSGYDRQ